MFLFNELSMHIIANAGPQFFKQMTKLHLFNKIKKLACCKNTRMKKGNIFFNIIINHIISCSFLNVYKKKNINEMETD
jgi:hypothetical protein